MNTTPELITVPEFESAYKYAGTLYPEEALDILAKSRNPQSAFNPDNMLTECLGNYITTNYALPEYAEKLYKAINKRSCLNGVLLRLNNHLQTQIDITGKTAKQINHIKQSRQKIRTFLQSNDCHITSRDTIYGGLATIHWQHDLEQALLGWAGAILIIIMSETDSGISIPKLNDKK